MRSRQNRRARRRVRGPRAERGQSLVVVLAFAAVLAAAFVFAAEAGRAVNERQRLLVAADAAAYGSAVWQARTLNAQAYLNRAIVANELAIAQSVSLRAWSDYMGQTLANGSAVTGWVPYLGSAMAALQRTWSGVDRTVQVSGRGIEIAASTVNTILAGAQQAIDALGPVGAQEIARETLRAHDVTASAAQPRLTAANAAEWRALTTEYGGLQRTRLRDTVLSGRDDFTRRRSYRIGALVARVEKRGGTDLHGFEAWRGLDTLAVHLRTGLLLGRFRERVPLGWGGAEAGVVRFADAAAHDGAAQVNPRAARLAERIATSRGRNPAYRGLPTTRDVREPWRRDDRTLAVTVEAERRPARGEPSRALATAVVAFERPHPRHDARREYPSLYNPYWRARLAPVAAASRVLARGPGDFLAAVAP